MKNRSATTRRPGSPPPGTSRRQKKFLEKGLRRLGFKTYREYLISDLWRETKERFRSKKKLLQSCLVCRAPNVDLHHRTYKRLGEERMSDLVPLCRDHHNQLHAEGLDFWRGPSILYQREIERRQKSQRLGRQAGLQTCLESE